MDLATTAQFLHHLDSELRMIGETNGCMLE